LRGEGDRAACREGLADGTLDAYCTDHAPHAWEVKMQEFDLAPFGIVGLETALGLAFTHLIPDIVDLNRMIERAVYAPREILSLLVPSIATGEAANLTIIEPTKTWTVDPSQFMSLSRNTPFKGWELTGRAKGIVNNGFAIIKDN